MKFTLFFVLIIALLSSFMTYAGPSKKKHKLNENVPSVLMDNMRTWILMSKPGSSMDFAGGKLYRIDEGARFIDALGVTVVIPLERPDYHYIANKSPALARYWLGKYGFKPNPPDYEYDNNTGVDDHLTLFDSLVRSMKTLREKEAEIRKKIATHPGVLKNFSCVNFGPEVDSQSQNELKNFCQEFIKAGMDHQELYEKIQKTKQELDAKGKNDLVIPEADTKFRKDFSPFIFKSQ